MKRTASMIIGFTLSEGIVLGVYWLAVQIWRQFRTLESKVFVTILTAATTFFVAIQTVVLSVAGLMIAGAVKYGKIKLEQARFNPSRTNHKASSPKQADTQTSIASTPQQ